MASYRVLPTYTDRNGDVAEAFVSVNKVVIGVVTRDGNSTYSARPQDEPRPIRSNFASPEAAAEFLAGRGR